MAELPPPEPDGTAPNDLPALATRWAAATLATSHVALSRNEIEARLLTLATGLADLLRAEPFDAEPAAEAGAVLVDTNLTGSDALRETLRLLGRHLLGAAGLPVDDERHGLLTDLLAALSAGYLTALRGRLFEDQEMIKKAVFRARDASERARRASEARWSTVFLSTAAGIAITDLSGTIRSANPALCGMLGVTEADLVGQPLADRIDAAEAPAVVAAFDQVATGAEDKFVGDLTFFHAKDNEVWTRFSLTLVRGAAEEPELAVAVVENITDLHLLRRNQLRMSLEDPLTKLANRAQFTSLLDAALQRAAVDEHIALCYVDLDGFKIINDGLDHVAGDRMLKRVAAALKEEFAEPGAVVARIGGDGFAVLLADTDGSYPISRRIEEVLAVLAEPDWTDPDLGVAVSASVGIVERPARELTSAELIRAAEITVHRAKLNGKAQWELYDPEQDKLYRARFRLGAAIPGALENGQFVITYEPFRRLDNDKLIGFRAQLHWNHPTRGHLRPAEFLDLAEETGFIVPLGRWMLEQVCAQLGEWQHRYGEVVRPIGLHLTPRLAREQDLIQILRDTLDKTGAWTDRLRLSIPASVIVDEQGEPLENLATLREIGLGAIIHGFGTGNAGLVDLSKLPVNGVAIAPSVVRAVGQSDVDSPLEDALRQIVTLANHVRVRVIADGVDTAELRTRLQNVGVHYASGPAIGEPLTAVEAGDLLGSQRR